MSVCPRCQNPYESGARFCPQCGLRLVEAEATGEEKPALSDNLSPSASRRPPTWLWVLIGAGVFLLILIMAVALFTQRQGLRSPGEAPASEAGLPEQLARVLGTLREAQVNKDLSLLMSCYATDFPERSQKIREMANAWQDFDFTAMFFSLEDLQPQGVAGARAKIVWDIQVQDRRTQEFLTATQTFRVEFVKEQGAWRIRSLEEVRAP